MAQKLLDQHETDAVVLACVDFRFRDKIAEAVRETFGIEHFDDIKLASGAGNLALVGRELPGREKAVLDDISLAVNGHHVKQVVLLTHETCGKYAELGHRFTDKDKEREFHAEELREASKRVTTIFPNVDVLLGFVYVEGDDTVKIERVSL